MKINEKGLDLIKSYESCRLVAYKCPSNVWTIGYGATGSGIREGLVWVREQAEKRLVDDVEKFEKAVKSKLTSEVNTNQFSAMVCLAFNIGPTAFSRSTLLKLVNSGQSEKAADEFLKWNKGGGKVLPGLVRRRAAERKLFLTVV